MIGHHGQFMHRSRVTVTFLCVAAVKVSSTPEPAVDSGQKSPTSPLALTLPQVRHSGFPATGNLPRGIFRVNFEHKLADSNG